MAIGLNISLLVLSFAVLLPGIAEAQSTPVFSIGVKDGSFREFHRDAETTRSIEYRVGESLPEKDWPAYQASSLDTAFAPSTMQHDWVTAKAHEAVSAPASFQVSFKLVSPAKGTFTLHLDAIFRYRHPAPPKYEVAINGKVAAVYQLAPHPAPELWWQNGGDSNGNMQYFGYESIDMQLPASAFSGGRNLLSVRCLDGFGIFYDDLSLVNDPGRVAPLIGVAFVEPSVLYKTRPSGLVELAKVHVRSSRPLGKVSLETAVGKTVIRKVVSQSTAGDIDTMIEVPAGDDALPVTLRVSGMKEPVYRGTFVPKRRWQVYALPMEQADFGYNDLPARTLEWENRFLDKTLAIQKKYLSYAFTLDASANLESYLATRDKQHGTELLGHLQSGKWGINGLYANFFTGLSTPEELFRTLDYSLRAGQLHEFPVDSASQTDEPSISWALPQILADAGIKYFTNGSDPIRGALNPIGHLNFHSPFYWEAATGAKVLMWSGVSYTAVDDMTWGGWNAESVEAGKYTASTFGLGRSLPLFLSQYEREDFPFDAVLLFGLHNDEIPMRHIGDADVVEMWNKEYAYPKVIFATQRDFFTHITSKYEEQIKTYRGDGGAYWEDEAGADARITAMIRTSQVQLAAAERFESIASWLQPHLKFDRQPFDSAWKNILLANSYVWSDANSFRRPESYRTRGGEAAHRAWAEAALQQTSDLRLIAMDKIAELVETKEQGTVVFNQESWPRSDFFDVELEPGETLRDPSTGQNLLCGVMKPREGYNEARCWAKDVPATGYKFFATVRGEVFEGREVPLDAANPTIENEYYRLTLNSKTGAIAHLIDKSTNIDLVSSGEYGMNEYLYVTGGDPGGDNQSIKDNRILTADVTLPLPELEVHHASVEAAPRALRFPWGVVVTIHSQATNTPEIISSITLLEGRKQIDIRNEVQKTATLCKEGIYFSFPFALQQPEMKYQGATAWVNPETDMLPGANRQWFTTQGGVYGKGTGNSVAWTSVDAPLISLEDINRGLWPEAIHIETGTLFSYIMNNYWYTDTPAQQGGQFVFRYALTSGADTSPAQAAILTAEQRAPLTSIRHYNMGWDPTLPDKGAGFLKISTAGVHIIALRPLDGKNTYLVRVQNTNSSDVTADIEFPTIPLDEVYAGSVMGDHTRAIPHTDHSVSIALGHNEIRTLVIRMKAR